jgi:energy-coupling factor transporter ATP-binding protein EcfA2
MSLKKHVSIARRFQRSIRLDSDIGQLEALQGFVCQRSAAAALTSIATQVRNSSQRAFTWTGPYGTGKSSLAVALAGLVGPRGPVRDAAMRVVGKVTGQAVLDAFTPTPHGWLTVAVSGRRADPVSDIWQALERARTGGDSTRGRPRREVASGRELIERLLEVAAARPKDGVLLLIDEMGKFLEGVAHDEGEIFFFQELAEAAARAKVRLVVVGILHQAFEQYAARLGREARDEWAKIQGRFIDIPLIAGVDEVVDLVGRAIVTSCAHRESLKVAKKLAESVRTRRPSSPADLHLRLDSCWPLHPATALLLGPMSRRRFGQNERSVFGFLSSAEPGGFQEFLSTAPEGGSTLFGPDRFWDFLRINLEPAILASNDSHRWAQAADAIERCEARGGTALHITLAKAIAAIDLFRNGSGLAADRDTLIGCVPSVSEGQVSAALDDLAKWSVAIFRKHVGAWSVYAGSDFDIDAAVTKISAQGTFLDLAKLSHLAGLQPVLAKRHYYQTGTMRWFQTELSLLDQVDKLIAKPTDAAGRFILVIPDGVESRREALSLCRTLSERGSDKLLGIGFPRQTVRITDLGKELGALEAVRHGRPELEGDNVARKEIAARIAAISAELEQELRAAFTQADWHVGGECVVLPPDASLSQLASDLADRRFDKAPIIHSELINRQRPSSNTQAGVRALMHAMTVASRLDLLGFDGYPVERGLYTTLLAASGLHAERGEDGFGFGAPSNTKLGRTFKPFWNATLALVADAADPISLDKLYQLWDAPPFGLRRGVMPVLALAFVLANQGRLAVYTDGIFQADVDDFFVDRLLQDEACIALRRVDNLDLRETLLKGAVVALEESTGQICLAQPLEVARHLVRFVRELPPWTRKTLSLKPETVEVRRILVQADDPHKALFIDLPIALGATDSDMSLFAGALRGALFELRDAYKLMMTQLSNCMLEALDHPQQADFRELRGRAATVANLSGDLRLDAFSARLGTFHGAVPEMEAIASLAINRPTRDWSDRDPDQATLALAEFALKFRRAELLARVKGRSPSREAMAFVIGTGAASQEVFAEFEVADHDRPQIRALAETLNGVLTRSGADRHIVLAALAAAGIDAVNVPARKLRKVG